MSALHFPSLLIGKASNENDISLSKGIYSSNFSVAKSLAGPSSKKLNAFTTSPPQALSKARKAK